MSTQAQKFSVLNRSQAKENAKRQRIQTLTTASEEVTPEGETLYDPDINLNYTYVESLTEEGKTIRTKRFVIKTEEDKQAWRDYYMKVVPNHAAKAAPLSKKMGKALGVVKGFISWRVDPYKTIQESFSEGFTEGHEPFESIRNNNNDVLKGTGMGNPL